MEHTYQTTLTLAVSEDVDADFAVLPLIISYRVDWLGTPEPYITKVIVDGDEVPPNFLWCVMANDEYLVKEMVDYASAERRG